MSLPKLTHSYDQNSRAHKCLSVLNSIFDDYNEGKLVPENKELFGLGSPSYLRVLQSMTIEGFDLIKYLHQQEPCEATRAYLIFCGKVLLRLSHLIHNKRIETDQETAEYFRDFMKGKE